MPTRKKPGIPKGLDKRLHNLIGGFRLVVDFTRGVLDLDPRTELNHAQRILATNLRVVFMVVRWDVYRRLELQAQALTMKTLLGLVPLLAVVFAIFRGFGGLRSLEGRIRDMIISNVSGSPELQTTVEQYLTEFVENIQTAELGVLSVVILVLTVISLLSHVEQSLNTIFGVHTNRPTGMRFAIYWALLTLGPVLLGSSLALTAALQSSGFAGALEDMGAVGRFWLRAAPMLATWFGFAALYFVVPNTRVRIVPVVLAAIVAGSAWSGAKYAFALYAKHAVTTKDIYGSLATFPLFIFWLYLSWLFILMGAQLCVAFQNANSYRPEHVQRQTSFEAFQRCMCRFFLEVSRAFQFGRQPPEMAKLGATLGIPQHLQGRILNALISGGFLRETDDGGLMPARALDGITLEDLLRHASTGIGTTPKMPNDNTQGHLDSIFDELLQSRQETLQRISFQELAARFPPSDAGKLEDGNPNQEPDGPREKAHFGASKKQGQAVGS